MTLEAALRLREWSLRRLSPDVVIVILAFGVLFGRPFLLLLDDWWNNPEAGHGLLLAPVAVWLAWRAGLQSTRAPRAWLGGAVLLGAVTLRFAADLAAELYTMRQSMVLAAVGLTVYYWGLGQLRAWLLPFTLLWLSIPLPELVTNTIALPLQFRASELGAMLLEWRHVPVRLTGNIILIPGHKLFVTEACSGLRSLTALLSLGVLIGGLFLRTPAGRIGILLATFPIAIVMNGIRVFLTGFLVYFVDPAMGDGFMHMTEGWLLFLVSFAGVGMVAVAVAMAERRWLAWRAEKAHA